MALSGSGSSLPVALSAAAGEITAFISSESKSIFLISKGGSFKWLPYVFPNWSGLWFTVDVNENLLTGFGLGPANSCSEWRLRVWLFLLKLLEKDPGCLMSALNACCPLWIEKVCAWKDFPGGSAPPGVFLVSVKESWILTLAAVR